MAAAAGRPVSHRLLAAVTELSDEQLTAALREAVAAKLLVTRPDNDGYDLRHALLREVIDADLLPGEQMSLHATYAQVLAGRPELADASSAVAAAELAAHWQAAGHPVHALPALVVAGRTAEQATAFPEAYRHYQQGLTLWDQVPNPEQLAAWVDLRRVGTPPPKVMRLRAASASNAPWGAFWPPTWPATCSRPAAGRTPIACSARCWMMRRRRPSASTMWQGSSKPLEGTSPPPGSI